MNNTYWIVVSKPLPRIVMDDIFLANTLIPKSELRVIEIEHSDGKSCWQALRRIDDKFIDWVTKTSPIETGNYRKAVMAREKKIVKHWGIDLESLEKKKLFTGIKVLSHRRSKRYDEH